MMKRLALGLALLLTSVGIAASQVQPVPQVGVTFGYIPKATYSAGWVGLVPAASTTDIVCLAGSTGKVISILYVQIDGSAGTTLKVPASLIRRAARNTAGTAAGTTANPANTITKMDTNSASAVATPISYTANPTITDSAGTILGTKQLAVSLTTMATVGYPAEFDFRENPSNLLAPLILRATADQVCINLNATSIASGLLTGQMVWTEE